MSEISHFVTCTLCSSPVPVTCRCTIHAALGGGADGSMVKSVRGNAEMFSVTREQLQPFEKFLTSIEGHLLSGTIFLVCA